MRSGSFEGVYIVELMDFYLDLDLATFLADELRFYELRRRGDLLGVYVD